jgi:H+/Cl- antiporter ClcA
MQTMHSAGEGGAIEARFVRQGRRNTRLVWVMAVSLGLIVLILLGLWAGQLGPKVHHMGRITHADARLFNGGPPPVQQTPASPPSAGGVTE